MRFLLNLVCNLYIVGSFSVCRLFFEIKKDQKGCMLLPSVSKYVALHFQVVVSVGTTCQKPINWQFLHNPRKREEVEDNLLYFAPTL